MKTFIKYCSLCRIKEYSKNKEKNSIMISRLLQSHINYHEVVTNENYIDSGNYLCLGFIEKDLELLVPEINNNYSIY